MSGVVAARGGVPRLRAKLERGEPVTVVAYGSSMTAGGRYLAALPAAVRNAFPAAPVTFANLGRAGFDSVLAAFDAQAVAAEQPDCVLLEFAINDHSPAIAPFIVPALLGTIAQIRAVRPACEFVFVLLERESDALAGNDAHRRIHDRLAATLGLPSIDLAALASTLVARGEAAYSGDGPTALTSDGVHHTPAAERLLGEPFAAAFLDVVRTSGEPLPLAPLPAPPPFAFTAAAFCAMIADKHELDRGLADAVLVPKSAGPANVSPTFFARARRAHPKAFVAGGAWGLGESEKAVDNIHHPREMLIAMEPGAALRLPLCGPFLVVMGLANGEPLAVRVDGVEVPLLPPRGHGVRGRLNWPLLITNGLADERHLIELAAYGKMTAITDIFYVEP